MKEYNVQCRSCETIHPIKANPKDIVAWRQGELIQDAMPYLTVDERELLISGICSSCYKKVFG